MIFIRSDAILIKTCRFFLPTKDGKKSYILNNISVKNV